MLVNRRIANQKTQKTLKTRIGEMPILAIDPGLHGAYALFGALGETPVVHDLPFVGNRVNPVEIVASLGVYVVMDVVIEAQQAMPHQGVSSTFLMGQNYGMLLGTFFLHASTRPGWSIHLVRPAIWKRAMELTRDKEKSRQKALELWPSLEPQLRRKKDEGRAEALLLGEYWRTKGDR